MGKHHVVSTTTSRLAGGNWIEDLPSAKNPSEPLSCAGVSTTRGGATSLALVNDELERYKTEQMSSGAGNEQIVTATPDIIKNMGVTEGRRRLLPHPVSLSHDTSESDHNSESSCSKDDLDDIEKEVPFLLCSLRKSVPQNTKPSPPASAPSDASPVTLAPKDDDSGENPGHDPSKNKSPKKKRLVSLPLKNKKKKSGEAKHNNETNAPAQPATAGPPAVAQQQQQAAFSAVDPFLLAVAASGTLPMMMFRANGGLTTSTAPSLDSIEPCLLQPKPKTSAVVKGAAAVAAAGNSGATRKRKRSPPIPSRTPLQTQQLLQAASAASTKSKAKQEVILECHPHDILSGRGNGVASFPGNCRFREYVREAKEEYVQAPRSEKNMIARIVVGRIKSLDPPGRFLERDPSGAAGGKDGWREMSFCRVLDKTSQALRENATQFRAKMGTRR